jgi:hypothetical protein
MHKKEMTLEGKDILQIDATVIAGVLILFTLTFHSRKMLV